MDVNEVTILIKAHPLFAKLSSQELATLARLFVERKYAAGQMIVEEGAVVDSVYCIVSGLVEVAKEANPIATLHPGEFIGLSESDFYSQTGKRTATITASVNAVLLRLDLAAFHHFFSTSSHLQETMRANADVLFRMNLIKRAAPFANVSVDQMKWLAESVSTRHLKKDEVIFQEGDKGNDCYLIQHGKIEIFRTQDDKEETIAQLSSPMIFGEAALLMKKPRMASARAVVDSTLLVFSRELLMTVIKKEKSISHSLLKLLKLRNKPRRHSYIEVFSRKASDGEAVITLKDSLNANYYQLSEEGLFIWNMLTGEHSIRDITLAYQQKFDAYDPDMISNFIIDLERANFIETSIGKWGQEFNKKSVWSKLIILIRNIMEVSVSFGNVDRFLTVTYQYGVRYLYTYVAQIIFASIAFSGFIVYVSYFHSHVEIFAKAHYSAWLYCAGFLLATMTIISHELAHAYTTKFCGRHVFSFGVGWYWVSPIAFCDTSDMWLANRKQRVYVDVAGLYADFILAGLCSLLTLIVHDPIAIFLLWMVALLNYLGVLLNLSPQLELDGYYLFIDLTNKENLRESSIVWLLKKSKKTFTSRARIKKYKYEIAYCCVCLIDLALAAIVPYIVMNFLLLGLFGTRNLLLSLLVSAGVILLSALSILEEIKSAKNR